MTRYSWDEEKRRAFSDDHGRWVLYADALHFAEIRGLATERRVRRETVEACVRAAEDAGALYPNRKAIRAALDQGEAGETREGGEQR